MNIKPYKSYGCTQAYGQVDIFVWNYVCRVVVWHQVELVFGKQAKFLPVDYHESMVCYGHNTTRRRYRSTVVYQPKMVPERFSDTCYVRPKRPTTTFVSYLDVGADDHCRRKWFSSAVQVEPLTVSNVVVGGFGWLQDSEQTDDWNESGTSSGICSEDDDDIDWSRADRYRTLNFNNGSRGTTTLVVNRHWIVTWCFLWEQLPHLQLNYSSLWRPWTNNCLVRLNSCSTTWPTVVNSASLLLTNSQLWFRRVCQ